MGARKVVPFTRHLVTTPVKYVTDDATKCLVNGTTFLAPIMVSF